MKKTILSLLILFRLILTEPLFSEENSKPFDSPSIGQASVDGKTSAATMAWAIVGISFLVVIGVVIAVTIAKDNK